jgi:hypothetical protein
MNEGWVRTETGGSNGSQREVNGKWELGGVHRWIKERPRVNGGRTRQEGGVHM